jgi:hypothetical protein
LFSFFTVKRIIKRIPSNRICFICKKRQLNKNVKKLLILNPEKIINFLILPGRFDAHKSEAFFVGQCCKNANYCHSIIFQFVLLFTIIYKMQVIAILSFFKLFIIMIYNYLENRSGAVRKFE